MCSLPAKYAPGLKHMLKITKETVDPKLLRISLHGYFTAEYIPEVKKSLSNGHKANAVVLDLTNVTFVDRTAMEFVREAKSKRIKVENTPSYVKRWMQQEAS
jgi:anti-anti-sigma regulatory factor